MIAGDAQAKRLPPQVSTSMNTTAEAISSTPPSQSTLRRRWKVGILPIFGSSSASEAMPSGTLIQKIIDQCRCSANTPPMIGPPIPAAVHTPVKYAWYWPRSRGRDDVGDHGLHDRQDAAAAEALQAARDDQHRHVRRQRAQHRARDEQRARRRSWRGGHRCR